VGLRFPLDADEVKAADTRDGPIGSELNGSLDAVMADERNNLLGGPAIRLAGRPEVSAVHYFFNVSNDDSIFKDEVGLTFSSPDDAKAHAAVIASELAEDDDWEDHSVVVVDAYGTEIARVPIGQ
jgi:hypothetical protein